MGWHKINLITEKSKVEIKAPAVIFILSNSPYNPGKGSLF